MSERIKEVFDRLRRSGEKALVAFVTAGDPDLEATEEIIAEMERRGVDIVELGVPFSDPMADGPTIQASSERALRRGTTLRDVLGLVARVRKKSGIPIVLFGYYNPVFVYGPANFARHAARAGVDGVLVVDLPPEEADELTTELDRVGIDFISLLAPTSDERRIALVASRASGFIYYVSLTGVTGARKKLSTAVSGAVRRIKAVTDLPVCVGFGVSTPEQAGAVGRSADGVVVGSAIIDIIAACGEREEIAGRVGDFVGELKAALAGR
ncbi:MAG TPA: tryptophan synthase subunit alpha [Deltaproteobacteria bacterium]|nr:tryptophan synthase subunit alpha [Deltaproteobacteria bacterium]